MQIHSGSKAAALCNYGLTVFPIEVRSRSQSPLKWSGAASQLVFEAPSTTRTFLDLHQHCVSFKFRLTSYWTPKSEMFFNTVMDFLHS